MRYLPIVVYLAVGVTVWRRERPKRNVEGIVSLVLWTLILGSLANFVLWVAFFH
jgi:hypothetical protein